MVGGRVREIPIRFTDRTRGASKMSSGVILEALALPWRVRSSARRLEGVSPTVSSESGRR
jgi:dolichol-phosphate mannosyltransferase